MKYDDLTILKCPNCNDHFLSDDGHDGNAIMKTQDGRIGIWYREFIEGNWSPTPVGCHECKKFYTLPDLTEVPFTARGWIFIKPDPAEDEKLKTPSGGYYTRRSFIGTPA